MTNSIHQIRVHFTDRTRANGSFVTQSSTVTVLAGSDSAALLLAAQITASTIHPDSMVVQTDLVL